MKLTIYSRHYMKQMEKITCHQKYFVKLALKYEEINYDEIEY